MGRRARPSISCSDYLLDGEQDGPPPDWRVGHFACVIGRVRGPGGNLYGVADTYPSLGSGGVHLQPQERLAAALERRDMPAGGMIAVAFAERCARGARRRRVRSGCARALGQRHRDAGRSSVSAAELVSLVCCDLGAIVRGRSLRASDLGGRLDLGVGWVPANHALTPLGPLAEPNPFGSTGDLRLLPDPATPACASRRPGRRTRWSCCCATSSRPTGSPWECCPRRFLRDALRELEARARRAGCVASFEHEFQLLLDAPPALPFSLEAQRRAEPFATQVMGALVEAGVQPERIFSEFAPHQFEIPVAPAEGLASADRSVVLKEVVREIARRNGLRASFAPLLDPAQAGNGVHIHLSLLDASGRPALYDEARRGVPERAGRALRGRNPAARGGAQRPDRSEPTIGRAPSAPPLERRRRLSGRAQPRSAAAHPAAGRARRRRGGVQLRLEYRGADAAANPYLVLGALVRAGLDGVRAELPAPPILDRDPALLDQDEAARYGVGALPGSLEDALQALAQDDAAREWMAPLLYDAYVGLKRSELEAVRALDLGEVCRRYAAVY